MLRTIVLVLLILLLIGALPTWPYSASWGYAPGGTLGTVLVVVLNLPYQEEYRVQRTFDFLDEGPRKRGIPRASPSRGIISRPRRG